MHLSAETMAASEKLEVNKSHLKLWQLVGISIAIAVHVDVGAVFGRPS